MWTRIKCFEYEESPCNPGKYMIRPIYENFYCTGTEGSYNVLPARLMGLTYADYLRMCRDLFGAELRGKNSKYVVPYFSNTVGLVRLVHLLNTRANIILWEREHPNWREVEEWANEHKLLEANNADNKR